MDIVIIKLIIFTTLFILISFFSAYYVVNRDLKKKGEKKKTIEEFLNRNTKLSLRNILVGMSFGIIFGFIDNLGLWIGLSSFEKYIPGNILTKSAWGNTYSNGLGATLGTSISIILKTYFPIEESPIWVDTIGILIGCIIGMYIPKFIYRNIYR